MLFSNSDIFPIMYLQTDKNLNSPIRLYSVWELD